MPRFQLLGCHIALAGDPRAVVPRGADNPVTYPEMLVLQMMHGVDAVTDPYEVGFTEDRTTVAERERLVATYTRKYVDDVLGGTAGIMPLRGDFPTEADITAAREASAEVLARRKAKAAAKQDAKTRPPAVEANVLGEDEIAEEV